MFNKKGSNNFDNIDLNNLKSYKSSNNLNSNEDDYNNYDNDIPNLAQPSKISSKNDAPIIKEMMDPNQNFMSLMRSRINDLRSVVDLHKSGRVEDSLTKISESNNLGSINDYFRYTLIKKDLSKINLNIDMALKIFPNIIKMVNCKHDIYFKTGIKTAWVILNYFSDQIIEVLKTPVFGGVDLNREEKIRKYKMIVDYFSKLRENPRVENNLKYKEIKRLNLKQFIGEVNFFLNQCQ